MRWFAQCHQRACDTAQPSWPWHARGALRFVVAAAALIAPVVDDAARAAEPAAQ